MCRIKSLHGNKNVFAQMEVANTMYYNTFSIKLIEDALYELCAAKLDWKDRTFVLRTGEHLPVSCSNMAQVNREKSVESVRNINTKRL